MARKLETDINRERKKDCVEKPMSFLQQQYKFGLNDNQSCVRIMSNETY